MQEQFPENDEVKFVFKPVREQIAKHFLSDIKEIPDIYVGDYHFKLELDELSPDMKERAKNELGETPEVTRDAMQKLRDLLKDEDKLKVPIDNDSWMIKFLRKTKFDPDRAFKLIKRYYRFKETYSNVYRDLTPSKEKKVFLQNMFMFQQERDQLGRRILTVFCGNRWNPKEVSPEDIFKGLVLLSELTLLEPQTQVCGGVVIVDMEGFSMSHLTKVSPSFVKMLLEWLQACTPLDVKNVHVINQPYIFKIVYNIIKMFLREDVKDRLLLHGSSHEALLNYLEPECLSKSYGGTLNLPTLVNGETWLNLLLQCDQEFNVINSYGYTSE